MDDLLSYGAAIAATFIIGWVAGATTKREELPAPTAITRMQDCMRTMGIRQHTKLADSNSPMQDCNE